MNEYEKRKVLYNCQHFLLTTPTSGPVEDFRYTYREPPHWPFYHKDGGLWYSELRRDGRRSEVFLRDLDREEMPEPVEEAPPIEWIDDAGWRIVED